MKKFMTLVLALVMVLAIAVPAMAFTSDTTEPSAASPYELDIYLVEYEDNDFFGITTLPPSDRGYAKNEIVAAVVELFVPKGEDPASDGYTRLIFDGEDVSFNVTENMSALMTSGNPGAVPAYNSTDKDLQDTVAVGDLDGKATYKWLFYAKVTGDEASLTASLVDGLGVPSSFASPYGLFLDGVQYTVTKTGFGGSSGSYSISVDSKDYAGAKINIYADKNYKTTGLTIATSSSAYVVSSNGSTLGILNTATGALTTSGAAYEAVMDIYDDVFVDVFGLSYANIGNYIRDSFFTGLVSAKTLTATVEIKPWTAYVTVPDNIVVDPPKTGDAASIVGFVMIVLAAAAVVAVKKVRA